MTSGQPGPVPSRGAGTNPPRVLVVHVQRTGGTSLRRMIEETQGPCAVYPTSVDLGARQGGRYLHPREVLDHWNRLPDHRFLFGHCMASFAELLPVSYARAAFLREPIERSISITRLHAELTNRAVSDLVYDIRFLESHVMDLQTRIFGVGVEAAMLRPQESPLATDEMLESAISRIRSFEFLGTHDTYRESLARFDATFGTRVAGSVRHDNRSSTGDMDRRQLAEIFAPMVERDRLLYECARG